MLLSIGLDYWMGENVLRSKSCKKGTFFFLSKISEYIIVTGLSCISLTFLEGF